MSEQLKNPERQKMGIGHFISRAAELHPDRIAIDDLLNRRTLTYAELDARINRLGRVLIRLGIGRGDMVASMLRNEHALVETVFACARIGAIVAPLNVRLIANEVRDYLDDHGCCAAIADSVFADRFDPVSVDTRISVGDETPPGWADYDALLNAESGDPLPAVTSLDDPYRLVMTGGTTGKSKGVVHSQGGSVITVLADVAEYGIGRGWQTLTILPGYHVAGMEWGMFTIFARAGTVVFPAGGSFDPAAYLDEVRMRGIEYLALVPAVINPLYDAWDGTPLDAPCTVVTTAAPTPLALRRRLAEMFPAADIFAAAGLSESLNLATQGPGEFLDQPAAIGEPHLDTRVLILDDDDRPVPRGMPGNIAMRNFNTALGYHRNAEAAAVTWRPRKDDPEGLHWCFTGDIGVMDAEGRITLVDRSKDVVKTGGESVPSVEVETAFAGHPHIRDCAVIGVEDERWGEAILLVAVPEANAPADSELAELLFSWGRGEMSAFKVPKKIAFVGELPRSHFGKVLKRDLRELAFDRLFEAAGGKNTA
ncbi:MAG: class I adenylate-forming enzyme family protein [Alphaproteobacteria bacterium]